jgi:2-dehydropantoate 2-reductase
LRICFHGAGALGSLFGGCLAEAGHDVVLIARPAHADAIREGGLRLTGLRGDHVVRERLETVTDVRDVTGELDVYALTVKAKATKAALSEASPLVSRTACALSFQNTVVKDDALLSAFGPDRVLGASTIEGATLIEPGLVRHTATCPTTAYFGELDGRTSPRSDEIAQVFNDAGFASKSVDVIRQVEWEKLLQIATVASWSVCALAAVPDAVIADGMANRYGAELYVTLATELLAIYRSLGFEPQDFYAPYSRYRELGGWSFEEAVEQIVAQGESMKAAGLTGRTSMHEDVLRGRRTEAPEILGPFLEQADAAGLESPTLRAVHRVVMTVDALLFGRSRSS